MDNLPMIVIEGSNELSFKDIVGNRGMVQFQPNENVLKITNWQLTDDSQFFQNVLSYVKKYSRKNGYTEIQIPIVSDDFGEFGFIRNGNIAKMKLF